MVSGVMISLRNPPGHRYDCGVKRWISWVRRQPWVPPGLFVLLVIVVRFKYVRQMVLDGLPYFADADCYTRMMRVKCLLQDGQVFRSFHPWENAPLGITTHATALMDLLIALPALAFSPFSANGLDWAGWVVSPVLAGLAAWLLWKWTSETSLDLDWTRWPLLLTFALHPLVLWSNSVGRPDHQALFVPLLTLTLVLDLLRARDSRWVWPSGLCWGLALWVSLYEPLALFLVSLILSGVYLRGQMLRWLAGVLAVAGPAWLLEGWRWGGLREAWHDPLLANWLAMVGELKSPPAWYWLSFPLTGVALVFAGYSSIAAFRARRARPAKSKAEAGPRWTFPVVYPWVLALILVGLSLWQQRWMTLLPFPLAWAVFQTLRPLRSPSWRTGWILLHLLPLVAWNLWEMPQLAPPKNMAQMRAMAREIQGEGTILAPWWLSPPLLYYSGRPIVASSSHQSLSGIVDSARFWTTADFVEAGEILQRRGVRWVAVYRPVRSFANSREILYGPGADPSIEQKDFYRYVLLRLWDFKMVPTRYQIVFASEDWKLYRYDP